MTAYQGPTQPRTALKVVEPDTPEHDAWRAEQDAKQAAYEARFAERACYRPGF